MSCFRWQPLIDKILYGIWDLRGRIKSRNDVKEESFVWSRDQKSVTSQKWGKVTRASRRITGSKHRLSRREKMRCYSWLSHKNRHDEIIFASAHQCRHHYSLLCDCKNWCLEMMRQEDVRRRSWQTRMSFLLSFPQVSQESVFVGEDFKKEDMTNKKWCDNNTEFPGVSRASR
jgi:hypothetical protein